MNRSEYMARYCDIESRLYGERRKYKIAKAARAQAGANAHSARGSMTDFSRVCQPSVISSAEVSVIAEISFTACANLNLFAFRIEITLACTFESFLVVSSIYTVHLCTGLIIFMYMISRCLRLSMLICTITYN